MTTAEVTFCTWCGDPLEGEELDNPGKIEGDIVCDECCEDWEYENSFECAVCHERHIDGEQSNFFILVDESLGIPGLYEAMEFPFYAQPMLGRPWMYEDAVRRVGELPAGAQVEEAPCEYVCTSCIKPEWVLPKVG